jgi:pimeloyl-ACP methyl ester carboxylesterase
MEGDAVTMSGTARSAGGRRGYADGPWGLVHYYDNAATPRAGSLPLLLLHQAPTSARQFEAVYEPLGRRGIRAIGIDTPGFGMSDPTPFVPKVEDWTAAVVAALDHLRIAKADALGHHTGSLLATDLALRYPDRVRYRVVNGPFWYGHNAACRYDHAAALQRLRHRTLVLTNTGDSIYELAQRARRIRPDFDYAELPGGGIDITEQRPEACSDRVAAFLAGGRS